MKVSEFVKEQIKLLKEFEKDSIRLNNAEIEYEDEEAWYQIFSESRAPLTCPKNYQ